MSRQGSSTMLESYDPRAPEKWEEWAREYQTIMANPFRLPHQTLRAKALTAAMCKAVSAGYSDPNRYVRWQLSYTLLEADMLDIWAWLPVMPNDAGLDDCRAAIAQVHDYVEIVKQRREIFAACRRAGVIPRYVRSLPKLSWGTRWAMLCFRLGRLYRRYKGYRSARAMDV